MDARLINYYELKKDHYGRSVRRTKIQFNSNKFISREEISDSILQIMNKYFKNETGDVVGDPLIIAENFTNINKSLDNITQWNHCQTVSFCFPLIILGWRQNIIHKLENKRSSGLDEVCLVILKAVANEICEPFTDVFNTCSNEGAFADELKLAALISVFEMLERIFLIIVPFFAFCVCSFSSYRMAYIWLTTCTSNKE